MNDINTHEIPPGGWQYFIPQTGWTAPTPVSSTHDQTVALIIKNLIANPAIVAKHNMRTDFASVSGLLLAFTRKRLGISEPPKQLPQQWLRSVRAVAAEAVSGIATLANWLGDGGSPVAQELADKRATICADCPQNGKGDWLATFTIPAQNLIRRQLQERKELKLSTSLDDKLNLCEACACPLHLKVHVPVAYILTHIPEESKAKLDPRCWIRHGT